MGTKTNYDFKPKSHKERYDECPLKRTQTKEGKWNLERKKDGTFISDIWFDNLGSWASYSCIIGEEHDIFGWDGLIFLEEPIKTPKSAYPYFVKAKIYHYSSDGELLSIGENGCGINGYGYTENVIY